MGESVKDQRFSFWIKKHPTPKKSLDYFSYGYFSKKDLYFKSNYGGRSSVG
jgi:hypothetical protein